MTDWFAVARDITLVHARLMGYPLGGGEPQADSAPVLAGFVSARQPTDPQPEPSPPPNTAVLTLIRGGKQ